VSKTYASDGRAQEAAAGSRACSAHGHLASATTWEFVAKELRTHRNPFCAAQRWGLGCHRTTPPPKAPLHSHGARTMGRAAAPGSCPVLARRLRRAASPQIPVWRGPLGREAGACTQHSGPATQPRAGNHGSRHAPPPPPGVARREERTRCGWPAAIQAGGRNNSATGGALLTAPCYQSHLSRSQQRAAQAARAAGPGPAPAAQASRHIAAQDLPAGPCGLHGSAQRSAAFDLGGRKVR
jgi:hypothetical protein